MRNGLKAMSGYLRGFYFAALAAAVVTLADVQSASAQTSGSTFTVTDVLDESDIQGKVETAATAMGAVVGTMVLVYLAFRLVQRALQWSRKAV